MNDIAELHSEFVSNRHRLSMRVALLAESLFKAIDVENVGTISRSQLEVFLSKAHTEHVESKKSHSLLERELMAKAEAISAEQAEEAARRQTLLSGPAPVIQRATSNFQRRRAAREHADIMHRLAASEEGSHDSGSSRSGSPASMDSIVSHAPGRKTRPAAGRNRLSRPPSSEVANWERRRGKARSDAASEVEIIGSFGRTVSTPKPRPDWDEGAAGAWGGSMHGEEADDWADRPATATLLYHRRRLPAPGEPPGRATAAAWTSIGVSAVAGRAPSREGFTSTRASTRSAVPPMTPSSFARTRSRELPTPSVASGATELSAAPRAFLVSKRRAAHMAATSAKAAAAESKLARLAEHPGVRVYVSLLTLRPARVCVTSEARACMCHF